MAKNDRGALSRASDSMGDVTVAKIMFQRVTSLLEAFQPEVRRALPISAQTIADCPMQSAGRMTAESMLALILQVRLILRTLLHTQADCV